ncbi:MAG TPA: alpha/beta hydrolase [Pyrinomonadaceae bacterium]|nr:alpha/beta hydrolase [Pyrinomonadaceae bacterium]
MGKRKLLFFFLMLAVLAVSNVAQSTPIKLWENGAPNARGIDPLDVPTVTPFPAPKEIGTGAAVLVLPGGGYARLSDVKEGSDVAKWLNSLGISAFVLKYRLGPRYNQPNPLLDAARAMRIIRSRASEWNIDADRIGILGFSAGGHLASTLGTHFDNGNPDSKDDIEKISSRPDLMVLIYPVITMGEFTHAGSKKNLLGENPTPELVKLYSNELQVIKETPPTFLIHTMTDSGVPVENSMMFASALRKAGVPFEFHLYEQGPHGFGLAPTNPILASWTSRCADWLGLHGFTKRKAANNN